MAPPLMALHITAHTKRLSAAGMGTAEGFLACMRVGVDAQRGRTRERLVAGAADISVVVLLVGSCRGGGKVVVVLPGWIHRGDQAVSWG